MTKKVFSSFREAVADVFDGATILIGGWGLRTGTATHLIRALHDQGTKNLCVVSNSAGMGLTDEGWGTYDDHAILVKNRRVRKAIASYPFPPRGGLTSPAKEQYLAGELEVEVVPQGVLAERIRAGAAGIGGFYTLVGVNTALEKGKEKRILDGKEYLLELPIKGDFAFIRAHAADTMGNLIYRGVGRVFNPVMAAAAKITIVETERLVEPGMLDPESIVTPCVYVNRIVLIPKDKP